VIAVDRVSTLRAVKRAVVLVTARALNRNLTYRLFSVCAVFGAAITAASTASGGSRVASRIVDRTFVCTVTESRGGYPDPVVRERIIRVSTVAETADFAGRAFVYDKHADFDSVLWMQSRPQVGTQGPGGIGVNRKRCTWARQLRIPLSAAGLREPTRFNEGFDCSVPRRILVRVRAVMKRPVSWTALGEYLRVGAAISQAQFALRTQANRRPLAFGVIDQNGQTTLAVSARCEDAW
jgi:hypothetical protein